MEIERKFLIAHMPENLDSYECKNIEQGYLCTAPVVRIRRSNEHYYLTYKSANRAVNEESGALECDEVERPLTREAYEHLRTKIDGNALTKKRYIIPLEGGLKAELDIFEGAFKGLQFTEVEFPDRETSQKFVKPEWFGEEVTFDNRFKNSYLSRIKGFDELGL
ncbi:MAG: CYTH domain-containing protein [Lachnospiraceae bacterium]|nr:CYTH domain-containing protein [Lachnospiraceae bacterium]